MVKKILRFIKQKWWILGSFTLVFILYSVGFRITYNSRIINDWQAIAAVADWAGVAATILIAYVLFKKENEKKPNIKLISNYLGDNQLSLKIYNAAKVDLVIKTINLYFGNNSVGRVYCENNTETDLLQDYYILKSGKVTEIEMPIGLFQSHLSEYYDRYNGNFYDDFLLEVKREKLKIEMTDIEDESFSATTKYSFTDYASNLMGN